VLGEPSGVKHTAPPIIFHKANHNGVHSITQHLHLVDHTYALYVEHTLTSSRKTGPSALRFSTTYSAKVGDQHQSLPSYTDSTDFVGIAFRAARAADPAAKLYINEYNLDSASYSKTRGLASAVKRWVAAGIPIDGVGSQSHLANNWPISEFAGALKSVCADVSECAITELDIKGASTSDYQAAVKACLDEAKCVGVTVWGISDTDSWRASDKPLLFDGSSQAKAAYNGLCSILV